MGMAATASLEVGWMGEGKAKREKGVEIGRAHV